jgi:hypothetical protein
VLPNLTASLKRSIQSVNEFVYADLMDPGTMFDGFQIRYLAFIAVEVVAFENRQGFGVLSDYVSNNHVSCDHV